MKKSILSTIIAGVVISFSACSTPEERATVVEDNDSINAPASAPTDSLNSSLGKMNGNLDTSSSSASNKKMESFRHTPIDTITSLSDTTKNK